MRRSLRVAWIFAGLILQGECFIVFGTTSRSHRPNLVIRPGWRTPCLRFPSTRRSMTQNDDTDNTKKESSKQKKQIVVSSERDMDIPIEVAYDAFRDLPRQPTWSPWLRSVEYVDGDKNKSLWKMKYFGLTFSWRAINTTLKRPYLIEWRSTSGLKNYGRVEFEKLSSNDTRMRFVMTFEPPRVVGGMMGEARTLRKMVENKMLQKTLQNFQEIVSEKDLKRTPMPVAQSSVN